jgi:hypothetical protein
MDTMMKDQLFDELFKLEQRLKEKNVIQFDPGAEIEMWSYRAELINRLENN